MKLSKHTIRAGIAAALLTLGATAFAAGGDIDGRRKAVAARADLVVTEARTALDAARAEGNPLELRVAVSRLRSAEAMRAEVTAARSVERLAEIELRLDVSGAAVAEGSAVAQRQGDQGGGGQVGGGQVGGGQVGGGQGNQGNRGNANNNANNNQGNQGNQQNRGTGVRRPQDENVPGGNTMFNQVTNIEGGVGDRSGQGQNVAQNQGSGQIVGGEAHGGSGLAGGGGAGSFQGGGAGGLGSGGTSGDFAGNGGGGASDAGAAVGAGTGRSGTGNGNPTGRPEREAGKPTPTPPPVSAR